MNLIELAKRLADDVRPGLNPEQIELVDEFNDAGEEWLAADVAMAFAATNNFPVDSDLVDEFLKYGDPKRASAVTRRTAA